MNAQEINTYIREALERINKNRKKSGEDNKIDFFILGEYLTLKGKLPKKWHNESKLSAKRTYQYYKINEGNWIGPSPRQLGKMNKEKFESVLKGREQLFGKTLLETSPDQSHDK